MKDDGRGIIGAAFQHALAPLRKTLTDDRGTEMAEHEHLAERLLIRTFFADPYSPWHRGTNEHAHGLLRQSLPKGTDLSGSTQRALNTIAHRFNTRTRQCLNWATPLEVSRNCVIVHPAHLVFERAS